MKANFLLIIGLLSIMNISLKAQMKVIGNGNVGIGAIPTPVSMLELADNKWIRLNSRSSTSGILFFESGSSTSTSIQTGAEISYDGLNDALRLGTVDNSSFKAGVYIKRATGNIGIGGLPTSTYKLEVQGTTWLTGEVKIGSLNSYPSPRLKIDPNSPSIYAIYEALPGTPAGTLGTSVQKWSSVYGMSFYANGVLLSSDERLKENIVQLENSLDKILSLRPVTFDYIPLPVPKDPEFKSVIESQNVKRQNKVGFLAQELIEVLPEAVEYDPKQDSYYVDYISIIPQLVKSIQEQQMQLTELKAQIELLKKAEGTR
jgi:hypothetical protein